MNRRIVILLSAIVVLIALLVIGLIHTKTQHRYFRNEGLVFGTYYNIRYEGSQDLEAQILSRLHDVDTTLSMFNPHSIVSRINRNEDVTLNHDLLTVYVQAGEVYTLSHGAFDITVAPLVNAWGFGFTDRTAGPTQPQIDSLLTFIGMDGLSLSGRQLHKADPRMMLDASAIAKGYACDVAAQVLRDAGCRNYLVDIGGEVVAQGVNDRGEAWRVGITKPEDDTTNTKQNLQAVIKAQSLCMATSGNYRRFYYEGGERRSHTIDPRNGYPVNHNLLSATVVSTTCTRADALATACMVMGAEDGKAMIETLDSTACYFIIADGDSLRVETSTNWEQIIGL